MNRNKKVSIALMGLALMIFSLTSFTKIAKAEDPAGVGYQVEPVFSKEQIDPDKGFYYIKTTPGSEQVIEAEVISTQEEPVDVKLSVLDAFTQNNGKMGYTDKSVKLDDTLKKPLSSLIKVEPNVVTVKNFEKKVVKFKLKVPNEAYEGVKAGALLFSKEDKEGKGITSKNEFRIGLLTSESGDAYNDSATLNLLDAKGTIKEAKKVVSLMLQNPEPKILTNLMIEATIKEKKTGKVVKTKAVNEYVMAPNSRFEFDLDWGIEKIPAGEFIATVEAKNGEHNWSLKKEFTISGELASDMNKTSPYQIVTPIWVKIVTIALGGSVVVVGTVINIRKKKRQQILRKVIRDRKKKKGKRRK